MPLEPVGTIQEMQPWMIARCGINCGVCLAYLRQKNHCSGCNGNEASMAHHCAVCVLRNCPEGGGLCVNCTRFPCPRLRQLDKRYRTKYGLSVIANLEQIRDSGMDVFLAQQQELWKCSQCGGVLCMHRTACPSCGHVRVIAPLPPLARRRDA